jgi:DNA topoisomerase-2
MTTELSKFKKLSEVEHILARPGIYIGNVSNTNTKTWLLSDDNMTESEVTYNPGLLKLFDEIISNSVDEHIRKGSVKNIWVDIFPMTGEIQIRDDGGIPVAKHPEYGTYIPEMIFGELRTGSNFNDEERITAGLNGLGAKLTSIYSTEFKVDTCDGKNRFVQTFRNNTQDRGKSVIQPSKDNGTTITFTPDYKRLDCELDSDNIAKIERRVYDVAGCNPGINVHLYGKRINIKSFKDYVELFTSEYVIEETDDYSVALTAVEDGQFRHVSFVNGIDTYNGGTHVDYVSNQIIYKLRELIKKKHKIEVKPNVIRQQMMVIMKCRINAPNFNSQTKEFMCSEVRDFGTSYTPSDKFIKRLFDSPVVEKVLDWVAAEKRKDELAELRKLNKQTQNNNFLKRITKFDDATSKDRSLCSLILTEGDSAATTILSARDPQTMGVFPLRGKFINVRDIEVKKLANNEEFQNIMAIMGLKVGTKVNSVDELRFGKILVATDADPDGQHIFGLIINMINEFWPELITMGVICKLNPPLIIAQQGKNTVEFFGTSEYTVWSETAGKHSHKYFKGLGSYATKDFKRFLVDSKYSVKITATDKADFEALDIAFDKSKADARKDWLLN